MELNAYKAMLERHAKERAELEKALNDALESKAKAAAWAEKAQPSSPRPTWAAKDLSPPSDADIARNKHNLAIKNRQQLAALDQKHAAEKALRDQELPQQFNGVAQDKTANPETLQFNEDQHPAPDTAHGNASQCADRFDPDEHRRQAIRKALSSHTSENSPNCMRSPDQGYEHDL